MLGKIEQLLKIAAYGVAALYFAGIVVTTIYLAQFGIYDTSLVSIDYVLKGLCFAIHLAIPISIVSVFVGNSRYAFSFNAAAPKPRGILFCLWCSILSSLLIGPLVIVL